MAKALGISFRNFVDALEAGKYHVTLARLGLYDAGQRKLSSKGDRLKQALPNKEIFAAELTIFLGQEFPEILQGASHSPGAANLEKVAALVQQKARQYHVNTVINVLRYLKTVDALRPVKKYVFNEGLHGAFAVAQVEVLAESSGKAVKEDLFRILRERLSFTTEQCVELVDKLVSEKRLEYMGGANLYLLKGRRL